jgi:hypothetical protein
LLGAVGVLYLERGQYYEAETYSMKFLEASKEALGVNHPNSLTAMNNLALAFDRQDRYFEAQDLYHCCVDCQKSTLGNDHPDTLMTMNNLAVALDNHGIYTTTSKDRQTNDLFFCMECIIIIIIILFVLSYCLNLCGDDIHIVSLSVRP